MSKKMSRRKFLKLAAGAGVAAAASGIVPWKFGLRDAFAFYQSPTTIPLYGTALRGIGTIGVAAPDLSFRDAVNRARRHAARRVIVALALDTGALVDDVQGAVAFADGFGGALGHTGAASDAVVTDLHCHSRSSRMIFLP